MLRRIRPIEFLLTLWDRIHSSLWFVPTAMTMGAIVLAWAALQIDLGFDAATSVWWLHSGSAQDASDLLQTLIGSLVTMTTLAISITMVVLTLAAGQLGPRVIRSFIDDWRTQVPLGLFVATIVYFVLILRLIHAGMDRGDVPNVAVTLGTLLFLICVGTLLFFLHHLSRSVVADVMIGRIGGALDAALRGLPEEESLAPEEGPFESETTVDLDRGGYLQAVDYDALVSLACRSGVVLNVLATPGLHALPGRHALAVLGGHRPDDRFIAKARRAFILGSAPTPVQDSEYWVRQLVEIGLRALSPGVNDQFTAVSVVDRLGLSLAIALDRAPPRRVWTDEDGEVRVIVRGEFIKGLMQSAFHDLTLAGSGSRMVATRLAILFRELGGRARSEAARAGLSDRIELLERAVERDMADPADRAEIRMLCSRARDAISAGSSPG